MLKLIIETATHKEILLLVGARSIEFQGKRCIAVYTSFGLQIIFNCNTEEDTANTLYSLMHNGSAKVTSYREFQRR